MTWRKRANRLSDVNCRMHTNPSIPALLFVVLAPGIAAAESRLSMTIFVDRTTIDVGRSINITVLVANTGDTSAERCRIEITPGQVACTSPSFSVASKREQAVTCNLTISDDGPVNVVAFVYWNEAGDSQDAPSKVVAQSISEVTVTQREWFKLSERQRFSAVAVVLLIFGSLIWLLLLRWRSSGKYLSFARIRSASVIVSLGVLASGIILNNGTMVVAGLALLLVCALLIILGKKGTKRLLLRVQKAGPIEFSVAVHATQSLAITDARKRAFKKPSASLDSALSSGAALHHYLDLYRLKMFVLESKLIPQNPPVPPAVNGRRDWFETLPARVTAALAVTDSAQLKEAYRTVQGYEEFAELFDLYVGPLLRKAKAGKTERIEAVTHAKILTQHFMEKASRDDFALPPNCLVIRAHLELALGAKEAAFSILYQAQNDSPLSLVTNYALCYYLMDLADDSYTALGYGDKALASLRKLDKELFAFTEKSVELRNLSTSVAFAKRLKEELEPYVIDKNKDLKNWLTKARLGVSNLVAYVIADSVLIDREEEARSYAQAIVDADPNNDFLDTWGLVRLNFGIANRDRKEVRAARKLFIQIARSWESSGNKYERKLGRLRLRAASAAAKLAEHWD